MLLKCSVIRANAQAHGARSITSLASYRLISPWTRKRALARLHVVTEMLINRGFRLGLLASSDKI